MMFKGKPVKVIITGQAKEEFEELNLVVGEEIAKGITSSDYQILLNSIKQKVDFLKVNPEFGIHIPDSASLESEKNSTHVMRQYRPQADFKPLRLCPGVRKVARMVAPQGADLGRVAPFDSQQCNQKFK